MANTEDFSKQILPITFKDLFILTGSRGIDSINIIIEIL